MEVKYKGKVNSAVLDYIKAGSFYQDDGDKIKLNWFCYEYANNIYDAIKKDAKLAQYTCGYTRKQIAEFCLYFAKRMRKSVYDRNAGKSNIIAVDARYIYEFYPENTYKMTQTLLEAASAAWGEQILTCANCPNRCLSECFEITDMFDNLEKTGWPT